MRVTQIKKILIDWRNIVILSFTFCIIMLTSRTNVKDNDRNNVLLKTKYSALIVDESKKTIEDVEKKLKSLNTNKSSGPDEIHPKLISEIAEILCKPLTILLNSSIRSGKIPKKWKTAIISAVFKKGSRSIAN